MTQGLVKQLDRDTQVGHFALIEKEMAVWNRVSHQRDFVTLIEGNSQGDGDGMGSGAFCGSG
jgi:hypothetical protein